MFETNVLRQIMRPVLYKATKFIRKWILEYIDVGRKGHIITNYHNRPCPKPQHLYI